MHRAKRAHTYRAQAKTLLWSCLDHMSPLAPGSSRALPIDLSVQEYLPRFSADPIRAGSAFSPLPTRSSPSGRVSPSIVLVKE